MKSKPTDSFDQLADRYDSWFDRHAAVFQSELEALKKVVPKNGKGLEVGVGSGRFAEALGIKTGIEPSEKFREMAKSRGIHVFEGIAEALPFPDKQFDFILLTTVICFLDSPLKGLEEAKRVLKSNGILIIGMIDRQSELGLQYEKRKQDNPLYQHAHFYAVDNVLAMLKQSGFAHKEIYQTVFSPLDEIKSTEPIKSGHGEGGFVVIKAVIL